MSRNRLSKDPIQDGDGALDRAIVELATNRSIVVIAASRLVAHLLRHRDQT
jgi:uncharacterized protein YaiI (UPF0178 family)